MSLQVTSQDIPYDYKKYIHNDWTSFFDSHQKDLQQIFNKTLVSKIYPKKKNIFKVFKYLSPTDIKVVLLGQDPYIGSEQIDGEKIPQAEGLSFSVPKSHRKIPPSLKNIFKSIPILVSNIKMVT